MKLRSLAVQIALCRPKVNPLAAALVILSCFALSNLARADSASFIFDTPGNPAPSQAGPWGTLTLNLNPDGTIALDVDTSPGFFIDLLEFNPLAGTSISGLPTNWIGGGAGSIPPFGSFSLATEAIPTQGLAVSSLSLTLTGSSPFSTVFDVVSAASGATVPFAAEIVTPSVGVGFAGATPTPEPSSLLLLGTGLLAFGLLARRRVWSDRTA